MSIELDVYVIRRSVQTALRRQLAVINVASVDPAVELSKVITEALWETAAITKTNGAEAGIRAGVEMIKKWID